MAYRVLKSVADTYLTSKYVAGTRSLDSNVGMAGTMDLYKLYGETYVSGSGGTTIELSRGLIRFDLGPLMAMTSSGRLALTDGTFRCHLWLRDVYGGQATPAGFTLSLFPLARTWEEGVGRDVVAYRDLDAANFLTASITSGVPVLWAVSGAAQTGSLGQSGVDIYVSGNLGAGSSSLEVTQTFTTGDEDLFMDVTSLVSGTLKGQIPDYGWRLSFVGHQEEDQVTRWVKRFGTRHLQDTTKRPRLVATWNDTVPSDNTGAWFDVGANVTLWSRRGTVLGNLVSGSSQITGSGCLLLDLISSRSVSSTTSSWSTSHSQSISYVTHSVEFFTFGVTASQIRTGIYTAPVTMSLLTQSLLNFLDGRSEISFETVWRSLDRSRVYSRAQWIPWRLVEGSLEAVPEKRYVVTVPNLQDEYSTSDVVTLRVFVQDNAQTPQPLRIPQEASSVVFRKMWWRVVEAFTKKVIVPYHDPGTLLSSDGGGHLFTIWMSDLYPNQVYELEFRYEETADPSEVKVLDNQGFRFKVVT